MKRCIAKITFFFFNLFFLLAGGNCIAQDIAAYTDYRDYLQAFDKGQFRQLEYLAVNSYKYGATAIAYVDNRNDFKIYYQGKSIFQLNAADFYYQVTDGLVVYKVGSVLYVFDRGDKKILSYYNSFLSANDSILCYFDDSNYSLKVYYNGRSAELESSLLERPKSVKTGSNTVAWVNQSSYFNVFYQGRQYEMENTAPVVYEAGGDLVAYVDGYDHYFRLFYKGDTARIDLFPPDSFKVGFGIMAYVDQLGNFRVFNDGATRRLLSDRPEFFKVKGEVVVYAYNGMFNAYYKGEVYQLDTYYPSDFQVGNYGVAWLDVSGRLKLFDKGKIYTASYEQINNYKLNGNVLKYEVGNNTVKIFYQGKNY